MILTTTSQKLQILLASARASYDCPIVTDYVDFTSSTTTPGMSPTTTSGTSTIDFLGAPAGSTQRKVNSVNLYNADTAAIVVTIIYYDAGATYNIITSMTVPVGATLQFTCLLYTSDAADE